MGCSGPEAQPIAWAEARGFIATSEIGGSRRGTQFLRRIALCTGLLLPLPTPATQHEEPEPDIHMLRIGTGGAHGTYFPIGTLIANVINDSAETVASTAPSHPPAVIAAAQISNGSVSNVRALHKGDLEAALVQADVAYWAYTGAAVFQSDKAHAGLRAVANLYPETVHLVARKGTGIRTVRDLRGRSVSLDGPGSGTLADARIILGAFNVLESDLKPVYLKPQFAAEKLASGGLDAFFVVAGYPTKAVLDLADTSGVHLVSVTGPPVANIIRDHPFFSQTTIPAGTYPGVGRTETLAVGAQLIVKAALPDDVIYHVTRALWSQLARSIFDAGHPKGRDVQLQKALTGVGIPLHPGAERYYREVGLLNAVTGSN